MIELDWNYIKENFRGPRFIIQLDDAIYDFCSSAVEKIMNERKESEEDMTKKEREQHKRDLAAVKQNGRTLEYVQNQTEEICLAAVKENGHALEFVKNQTPEICMATVKDYGLALIHVKNQTPEICMAAVQKNGYALKYVKNQTPEICMAAVQKNGWALEYVKTQTDEICMAAVKQNPYALKYVKNQTPEICIAAIKEDPMALNYMNVRKILSLELFLKRRLRECLNEIGDMDPDYYHGAVIRINMLAVEGKDIKSFVLELITILEEVEEMKRRIIENTVRVESRTEQIVTKDNITTVRMVVLGANDDDFDINIIGDKLVIEYKPGDKSEHEWLEKTPFKREYAIKAPIDVENVKATYKGGILEVTAPHIVKEEPRIEIKVNS